MEWKPECDLLLLQEIIVSEPYQYKVSTRERGKIWEDITERLDAIRELTNRRLSHDNVVGSRHSPVSSSCRNLNLQFSKDNDVCSRATKFSRRF